MPKKKKFKVAENESLGECLERMRGEGYQPVRRMEQPVFIERDGERVVDHQEIIFEGKRVESQTDN
ncbi:NETI motif-containing protein [Salinicoccus hispanicus]|uniref:NETI motif-containing protein n=1 Tax=Salinicoccus hispanicus TaxID=157225 RepID=A0A6N8U2B6_9STAP|nr:NETI motif-containing protein [Salinicoccus hispanicus]MXQ51942.1 NETI motif-containing protein [Salinicoccus hispanicus]